MIIDFCGIHLRRLEQCDIEMLREWRNDLKITQHMFYQDYISPEMQQVWFDKLRDRDFYFIIEVEEESIGLIHLVNDEETLDTAYAGLFIYEETYWGTQIPVLASLALLRFAFEELSLSKVKAMVRKENKAALQYNEQLGFERLTEEVQALSAKDYEEKVRKLIDLSMKTYGIK